MRPACVCRIWLRVNSPRPGRAGGAKTASFRLRRHAAIDTSAKAFAARASAPARNTAERRTARPLADVGPETRQHFGPCMAAPLFADYLVERRLLQRRLSFWRVAAFAAAAAAVVILGLRLFSGDGPFSFSPHIARLTIDGVITGDRDTLKLISNSGRLPGRGGSDFDRQPRRHDDGGGAAFRGDPSPVRQKADCGRRRNARGVRRVYRGAWGRRDRRAGQFAGRIDRRSRRISEFRQIAGYDRRQGRGREILAAESLAQRF